MKNKNFVSRISTSPKVDFDQVFILSCCQIDHREAIGSAALHTKRKDSDFHLPYLAKG